VKHGNQFNKRNGGVWTSHGTQTYVRRHGYHNVAVHAKYSGKSESRSNGGPARAVELQMETEEHAHVALSYHRAARPGADRHGWHRRLRRGQKDLRRGTDPSKPQSRQRAAAGGPRTP
jgi:hypothetical protein